MFPPNSNPSHYPIQIKHHLTKTSSKNLLILSLIFPFQKFPRPVILFVFPFPFPDFFTLRSPLYLPASFPFFALQHTEPNQTHPNFLFPFQIFLILQGFSGFLSLFDFRLITGPLTKPNQIKLKIESGKKSENGYEKEREGC